jgi:predicted acyl esterase
MPAAIMDAMRFGVLLVSTTAFALFAAITGTPMVLGATPAPSPATQISEIPDKFVMPEPQKDYLKRIEMIPMRDGVRLYTVIIIPKGAKDAPLSSHARPTTPPDFSRITTRLWRG